MRKSRLLTAVAAATLLTGGIAMAATPQANGQQGDHGPQATVNKDFGKLSTEGIQAFQDITLTRAAIFGGHIDQAKTDLKNASAALDKAKTEDSVFMKAESDLKPPSNMKTANESAAPANQSSSTASNDQAKSADQMKKIAWLPVDGFTLIDEDYNVSPAKSAAVADANKSVAKGDQKGAAEKLKLADLNYEVTLAVLPLQQTIDDVNQATTLLNNGKYYEASQLLRKAQTAERFDAVDITGGPSALGQVQNAHPQHAANKTETSTH